MALIGWSASSRVVPGASAATTSFTSTADALVTSSSPNKNQGRSAKLQVRAPSPEYRSYLRFQVAGLPSPASEARLRLYVTDASPVGGTIFAISGDWSETAITWSNKPSLGAQLGTIGAVAVNTWVEVPIAPAGFSADGMYSLAITSSSTNSVVYGSRETANPPQLVLTTGAPSPTVTPTPPPTPTPTP
ncbi:MAG TPA: DNRLRE domain-containing protein, partial [Candidatus Limnocylindrales bacterium]|nr:DNRLRE domain-containing protein [Candidatus Limnocylindrales bacterium]